MTVPADPPVLFSNWTGTVVPTMLAHIAFEQGDSALAEEMIARSFRAHASPSLSQDHRYYDLTRLHAMRGDYSRATATFDSAINAGWRFVNTYMGSNDPVLKNFRSHAGFQHHTAALKRTLEAQRRQIDLVETQSAERAFEFMFRAATARLDTLRAQGR